MRSLVFSRIGLAVVVVLLALLGLAVPVEAGSSVTDCTKYGPGSGTLQEALVGGGTITFVCDGNIIVPQIKIGTDVVISAMGHSVILSGSTYNRVFYVQPGGNLELEHVVITEGRAGGEMSPLFDGGGIYNAGTLRLIDSTIQDCHATDDFPHPSYVNGTGGGIFNVGALNSDRQCRAEQRQRAERWRHRQRGRERNACQHSGAGEQW